MNWIVCIGMWAVPAREMFSIFLRDLGCSQTYFQVIYLTKIWSAIKYFRWNRTESCSNYWTKLFHLLTDGIYPEWSLFAKQLKGSTIHNDSCYSALQEAIRKDVKRIFGVIQWRFEIMRRKLRVWEPGDIIAVEDTCMVLKNLIVCMQKGGEFEEEARHINLVTEL